MRSGPFLLPAAALACLGAGFAAPAGAADIAAASRIDTVTVYPASAEISRTATVGIAQGEHTVIFSDLPAQAVASSIRVEGRATAKLDIGSVDSRRLRLQRDESAQAAAERRRLEEEIERTRDVRGGLQALIETAQTQKSFVTNLAELPKRPAPAAAAGAREDWGSVLGLIGNSMSEVHRIILETQIKIRDTDRKIQDLEKKLAALAPAPEERTEVKVFVAAAAGLEATLTITYQVPGASWTPLYDARLATGTKAAPPKLTLTRRASIQQRTGEPWDNVRLALSTARPTGGSAAPDLLPITVDFESEKPPRPVAMAPAPQTRTAAPMAGAVADQDGQRQRANATAKLESVGQAAATLEAAPFQAVFNTQGRLSIPNTGEAKRVFLQEEAIDPALLVQTVPKLEASYARKLVTA